METASEITPGDPADVKERTERNSLWWILLACLVILVVRASDTVFNPQFWAEDGPVYFMTARIQGARSLLRPYEANTYLIHRAIAYAGSFAPVRYAPAFYAYATLALTLMVLAYIARSRIQARYRGWMAIAAVCVPSTGEVFLRFNNLHWFLGLAMLVMAVAADPRTRLGKILEPAALICMALDGPLVFLFAPLFVIRAIRYRTRYSLVLVAIVGAAVIWQMGLVQRHLHLAGTVTPLYKDVLYPGTFKPWDREWLAFWGNCVSGILLLGRYITEAFPKSAAMTGLTVLLYGWLVFYGVRWGNWTYFGFLWGIVSVFAALVYIYHGQPMYATFSPGWRHSFIPYVCTMWILLLMIEQHGQSAKAAAVLLGFIAISSLTNFEFGALPDKQWAEKSRCIGGPVPCAVPVNGVPDGAWRIYYDPAIEAGGQARETDSPHQSPSAPDPPRER